MKIEIEKTTGFIIFHATYACGPLLQAQGPIYIGASGSMAPGTEVPRGPFLKQK